MKPIEYYTTVVAPAPNRAAVTTIFWYSQGAVYAKKMPGWEVPLLAEGNFTQPVTDAHRLEDRPRDTKFDQAEYDRVAGVYQQERQRLEEEFCLDALDEVGLAGDPAAHVIFCKAYDEGHAGGHGEVMSLLRSLASFVREVDVARMPKK